MTLFFTDMLLSGLRLETVYQGSFSRLRDHAILAQGSVDLGGQMACWPLSLRS